MRVPASASFFRLRAWIPIEKLKLTQADLPPTRQPLAPIATRRAYFDDAGGYVECPIYRRTDLRPGDTIEGAAIVEQMDATTVVLAVEEDPADDNHARSIDNLRRLELASQSGDPLRVVKLPFPRPVMMNGERLPASYANFYIANGVVLVPTFNDPNDRIALNTLAELMPSRQVIGIHAVDLVWGLGTLHCLTQQEPAART